jgi:hypothetical protein
MSEGADQSTESSNDQNPTSRVPETSTVRKLVVPEDITPSENPDGDRSPGLVDRTPNEPKSPKTPEPKEEEPPVIRKLVVPDTVNPSDSPDDDRSPGLVDRDLSGSTEGSAQQDSDPKKTEVDGETPVIRKLVIPDQPES